MAECGAMVESRPWTANSSSKDLLTSQGVLPHPMPICESANMAATPLPQLDYKIHPCVLQIAKKGHLSDMQLETAAYASQAITKRHSGKAFFLGDATGIGKTRSAISVILDRAAKVNETLGPDAKFHVLWVSCRGDLENEVKDTLRLLERHASDDDMHLKWHSLTSIVTSDGAEPQPKRRKKQLPQPTGVMLGDFAYVTYGSLRRGITGTDVTNASTLNGAIAWLNRASESIIVFDEAHISKTPKSASHVAVCKLQHDAQRSGVIYCTATPASDITNIGYMERLGLFGHWLESPFSTYMECQRHLRKGGVSALELVALHLKSRGLYMSRMLSAPDTALSMHGDPIPVRLTPAQRALYDEYCSLWTQQTDVPNAVLRTTPGIFTSMRQSFFLKLITAFKAQAVLSTVRDAISHGWAVVISIQSTGNGTDSTSCSDILKKCAIPTSRYRDLPRDALDTLILGLHEKDDIGPVAEITGRRHRIEFNTEGSIVQVPRTSKQVKLEVQQFQQGQMNVAILSAAGGTGISLHASQPYSKRRLHILLELPWSSETLVQQCGRTHRTGEIIPPLYRVVTADVPADWRVAQTVSKRLENLGALSRGDRRHQQVHPDIENTSMITPAVMHRAGFEIVMRESYERFNKLLLHEAYNVLCRQPMTRLHARDALQVGSGYNHDAIQSKASGRLAQVLTDLDDYELLAADNENYPLYKTKLDMLSQTFITVFRAAQILLPEDDCDTDQDRQWSIKTHHSFSKRKREMARMVWLCARLPSKSNCFSVINSDVLELIITNVLDDGWSYMPSYVVKCLKHSGIPRINLIKGPPDTLFFPRFSAVPVDVQTMVWTSISRATEYVNTSCVVRSKRRDTKQLMPRGTASILNHCFPNGVMPGCQARCLSLTHKVSPPGHVLIEIDVHPLQTPAPVSNTVFHEAMRSRFNCSQHAPSKSVVGMYYSQGSHAIRIAINRQHSTGERAVAWDIEVYAAGVVDPISKVTLENWGKWKNEYLSEIPSCISLETLKLQWQKEEKIQQKRRTTRCAKSRIIVEVVTAKHALYEWEDTTGVLVRGEMPFLPEPVMGVVTSTKRFH